MYILLNYCLFFCYFYLQQRPDYRLLCIPSIASNAAVLTNFSTVLKIIWTNMNRASAPKRLCCFCWWRCLATWKKKYHLHIKRFWKRAYCHCNVWNNNLIKWWIKNKLLIRPYYNLFSATIMFLYLGFRISHILFLKNLFKEVTFDNW